MEKLVSCSRSVVLRKPTVSIVSGGREATNHVLTNSGSHGGFNTNERRGIGKGCRVTLWGSFAA